MASETTHERTTLTARLAAVREQLSEVVVGQEQVVEQLLVALLAGGHCLLEGVPGSARWLTAATLARALGLSARRVCCTAELSAAEVTGEDLLDAGAATAELPPDSPLAAHVVLADDIDRLAPASRAVFQQAMQDGAVRMRGKACPLPQPFLLLASKYRAPEVAGDVSAEPRDDRFLLKIAVGYPSYHHEFELAQLPAEPDGNVPTLLDPAAILQLRCRVPETTAAPHVVHYAVRLVRATRVHEGENPDFIYEWIASGAGPRAAHHLLLAAKARAVLDARDASNAADVQALAHSVLRHRLVTNHNARSNGITPDHVIDRLLHEIPQRTEGDDQPPEPGQALAFDITSASDLLEGGEL